VQIAVAVSHLLTGQDLSRLTVSLADERFGKPGHADSNWRQLLDAGFSVPGATVVPVLTGAARETTTQKWGIQLTQLLNTSNYRIALLGIGPDGHTSGILPGSEAVTSRDVVTSYDGGGYQRITTTPAGLRLVDEAVVYAVGESKRTALQNLQKLLSVSEQPAQLLKSISKVTVYNDEIGGTQ
jgi:6-phosphogluconolactonase/glucosamine-6-phosphate isomerase/deaminase